MTPYAPLLTHFLPFNNLFSPSSDIQGSGRAIPLHALQTTNIIVFVMVLWLIAMLAHIIHSSSMQL